MDIQKIRKYIELYKEQFHEINKKEIYKWKIIKTFQDNWDVDASDFAEMINRSLSNTQNLLDSSNYYPRRMLIFNAQTTPDKIRRLFKNLFDEEIDLSTRIENYRQRFKELNYLHHSDKPNDYQDQRALIAYLTLRYPERYFFYKFGMLDDFCKKVDYPYTVSRGSMDNIIQFIHLSQLCRGIISKDQDLVKMHNERLIANCYHDVNLNILTQDFIYAVVTYLDVIDNNEVDLKANVVGIGKIENVKTVDQKNKEIKCSFSPRFINFEDNNKRNKELGDFGELWVLEYEKKILRDSGKTELLEKVQHVAKTKGDGAGYDILSFDIDGNPKQIEVKTTRSKCNTLMYISKNELECSRMNPDHYYLYRIYNFEPDKGCADLKIFKGPLDPICTTPSTYVVNLQDDNEEEDGSDG